MIKSVIRPPQSFLKDIKDENGNRIKVVVYDEKEIARWYNEICKLLNKLCTPPSFRAYVNSQQPLTAGVEATVIFGVANKNVGDWFDVTTYTATIPVGYAGEYDVVVMINVAVNSDGDSYVAKIKRIRAAVTTTVTQKHFVAKGTAQQTISLVDSLDFLDNDQIFVTVINVSNNDTVEAGTALTYFTMTRKSD